MGQLFSSGGLTQEGIRLPNGGFENASMAQNTIPSFPAGTDLNTPSIPGQVVKPSFLQAASAPNPATGMPVSPLQNPGLSKLGKLAVLLTSGAQGALAGQAASEEMVAASGGRRAGGVGTGFTAGYSLPFLRAQQQQQVQRGALENQQLQQMQQPVTLDDGRTVPIWMARQIADYNKSLSETQKNQAEAGKAGAEAGAIPIKSQLEQAQTEASYFKDDPNLGLIDLRTKQPVTSAGLAPLTADEAAILGKQAGDQVPLKLKNTANEMVNRGIRSVQAGGRSLLVDNKGNTVKDMGASTPIVTLQQQLGAAGSPQSPEFQAVAQSVARGDIDLNTAMSRLGRYPGVSFALMSEVEKINPSFFQGNEKAAEAVLKSFTSGGYSQNLNAIDTARRHMATFKSLAGDLDNGSVRAFNALGNALGIQFGSDSATNFNIARQFFSGEVAKSVVAGGGTAGERDQLAESISTSSSWKQLAGALKTADALLSGKQEALKNTYTSGRNATPNFGGAGGGQQQNVKYYNGVPYAQQDDGSWKKQQAVR